MNIVGYLLQSFLWCLVRLGSESVLENVLFCFPHKLLTSEQWYEHKSQYIPSAFNLQDSYVWSHRLQLQLQSKAEKEERFMLLLAALWHILRYVCTSKRLDKSVSPFPTVLFHVWLLCAHQWSNTTLCCLEINYAKSWF